MRAASLPGQEMRYASYFEEAYQQYPIIPRGVLEAVAYTQTRMNHIEPIPSCSDLPQRYGVMGLVLDGKGYFQNNLLKVAEMSGYSVEDIMRDARINILAYAKAYASLQTNKRMIQRSVDQQQPVLAELSEIPATDSTVVNQYARDQQFYAILSEIQSPHTNTRNRTRQVFNFEEIFGKENYRVLSSSWVTVSREKVRSINGTEYQRNASACTAAGSTPDYAGALWNPANARNFSARSSGEVKYVTIHTVQGSYSSCISWFRNPNARVSAHYVIRASDGQVTQMVCESDKAFHVRTDNDLAIGIEHEGFIDDGGAWYTNEMYESSAALVRDICRRHNIDPMKMFAGPPTNGRRSLSNQCYLIKGHQHFPGNDHIDPGPLWDWDRYFRLVNPGPAPVVLRERTGDIFDSGRAGANYGDLERLAYRIEPPNSASISLKFIELDLEGTEAQPFDYLDVYDGPDANGQFLGRFTGNQLPGELLARSGKMYIEFRSDCQVNRRGYRLAWQARFETPNCPLPQDLLARDLFPMGATLAWSAVPQASAYRVQLRRKLENTWESYTLAEPVLPITGLSSNGLYQWQVQAVCGQDTSALAGESFLTPNIMAARDQEFTTRLNRGRFHDSGGTFSGYTNGEKYTYRIIPADGGRVELRFARFATEQDKDVLTVYDGQNASARVLGTFSGTQVPPLITSSGNGLTLVFSSDNRTNAAGWQASWRSLGGSLAGGGQTDPLPQPNPNPNPNPNPTPGPTPPTAAFPGNLDFDPGIGYAAGVPGTSADLKERYSGTFKLAFNDEDRSSRGWYYRFYNLAQEKGGDIRSNDQAGFFYDDFARLDPAWKRASGSWELRGGRLVQIDANADNTNLYASLRQSSKEVYLYHWKAAMSKEGSNRRHGLHFFCSEPAALHRGISYFVWIRDSDGQDFVEIYKTVNEQIDRKIQQRLEIEAGKVYDYKVIADMSKALIEVYVNDVLVAAWVDPFPLSTGTGVSFRTGGSVTAIDEFRVYKSRGESVQVSVGAESRQDLAADGRAVVSSLVLDRLKKWSRPSRQLTQVGPGTGGNPNVPPAGQDPSPDPSPGPAPSPAGPLSVEFPVSSGGTLYVLPAWKDGNAWSANPALGYLSDDFSRESLGPLWTAAAGNWTSDNGIVSQNAENQQNGNLFAALAQTNEGAYLYQWRVRLNSQADNARFGLHFFCSEGGAQNRGNSYLIWFRSQTQLPDRVEIYRSSNNILPRFSTAVNLTFTPGTWYDIKVLYDPRSGQIEGFVNDQRVIAWKDDNAPLQRGEYISLRTGNSRIQVDEFRVFRLQASSKLLLTQGDGGDAMVKPLPRASLAVFNLTRDSSGKWSSIRQAKP